MLRNPSAEVVPDPSGRLAVRRATTDIDAGSYTVPTQIAAETMGLPISQVRMLLGDTDVPPTARAVGSFGTKISSSAVFRACEALRGRLAAAAIADAATLVSPDGWIVSGGSGKVCMRRMLSASVFGRVLNAKIALRAIAGRHDLGAEQRAGRGERGRSAPRRLPADLLLVPEEDGL